TVRPDSMLVSRACLFAFAFPGAPKGALLNDRPLDRLPSLLETRAPSHPRGAEGALWHVPSNLCPCSLPRRQAVGEPAATDAAGSPTACRRGSEHGHKLEGTCHSAPSAPLG